MNTGAQSEPRSSRIRFSFLALLVRLLGPAPFAGIAMKELFGDSTRSDPSKRAMLQEWRSKIRSRPRHIAEAVLGVMKRSEIADDELRAIQCPTLIIAGEEDTARPPADSEYLSATIPGSRLVRVPKCGHSSALEAPDDVTSAMMEMLGVAASRHASSSV